MLVATAILAVALQLMAETETVNGIEWTYTVANGVASVGVGSSSSPAVPKSTSGTITIPSSLGGYPVTSIRFAAFSGCNDITRVTIPATVTRIDAGAFAGCVNLELIAVSSGNQTYKIGFNLLLTIDGKDLVAVPGASTSVTIPDDVLNIGGYAFYKCRGLKSVTIPNGVTSIGKWAVA